MTTAYAIDSESKVASIVAAFREVKSMDIPNIHQCTGQIVIDEKKGKVGIMVLRYGVHDYKSRRTREVVKARGQMPPRHLLPYLGFEQRNTDFRGVPGRPFRPREKAT